jgi:hypothetical protein
MESRPKLFPKFYGPFSAAELLEFAANGNSRQTPRPREPQIGKTDTTGYNRHAHAKGVLLAWRNTIRATGPGKQNL